MTCPQPVATEVLRLWEAAADPRPAARDLALVAAHRPDLSAQALDAMTLGGLEVELLRLYRQLFGPELAGLFTCQGCGEVLEVNLDAEALAGLSPPADAPSLGPRPSDRTSLEHGWRSFTRDGLRVTVRPPTSGDLAVATEIALASGLGAARAELAGRVLTASRNGAAVPVDLLPAQVLQEALAVMADADPAAELTVVAQCPACARDCTVVVDLGAFVWARLDRQARSLLTQVATLAHAFGWSEGEILAMDARRRSAYLELVR